MSNESKECIGIVLDTESALILSKTLSKIIDKEISGNFLSNEEFGCLVHVALAFDTKLHPC